MTLLKEPDCGTPAKDGAASEPVGAPEPIKPVAAVGVSADA